MVVVLGFANRRGGKGVKELTDTVAVGGRCAEGIAAFQGTVFCNLRGERLEG